MLKKKILISLVIIQGLLIIAGIIAIIFGVFYKMSNNDNKTIIMNKNIGLNDVYLINENQYQQKLIKDNKAIFQIVDIEMNKVLKEANEISQYAPRILSLTINPEKIGALIGPGGKNIKKIIEDTECEVNVDDDGLVSSPCKHNTCRYKPIKSTHTQFLLSHAKYFYVSPF